LAVNEIKREKGRWNASSKNDCKLDIMVGDGSQYPNHLPSKDRSRKLIKDPFNTLLVSVDVQWMKTLTSV
jgi:hypothetical protein